MRSPPRSTDVDLILTEGYKRAGKPAIEVIASSNGLERISQPPQLVAIASDTRLETELPLFDLEESQARRIGSWMCL